MISLRATGRGGVPDVMRAAARAVCSVVYLFCSAHPNSGDRAHARGRQLRGAGAGLVRWLWALGLRAQHDNTTTQQHYKGPAGGGQGAQWPRAWPRVGIHMHRPRARGATLSLACAVLVEGERPAAGVAGGGLRGRSIQPPGALMGP